jgi:hypothetical protein
VVRERISIQAKELLVGFAFQLVAFRLDVPGLHVYPPIVKLEDRNVSITIDGDIAFTWGHEWIHHNAIE